MSTALGKLSLGLLLLGCGAPPTQTALRAVVLESQPVGIERTGLAYLLRGAKFEVSAVTTADSLDLSGTDLMAFGSFVSRESGYAQFIARHREKMLAFVRRGGVVLQMSQDPSQEPYFELLSGDYRAGRQPGSWKQSFVRDEDHLLLRELPRSQHGGMSSLDLPDLDEEKPSRFPLAIVPASRQVVMADRRGQSTTLYEAQMDSGRILLTSFWFDRSVNAEGKPRGEVALSNAAQHFFDNLHDYVAALRQHKLPNVRKFEFCPTPEPPPFIPGSWTLVVLPDTQGYSRSHPEIFRAQTEWIAAHVNERNIRYVVHLGDLTNDNLPAQWQVAKDAMSLLDGKVGYTLCTGNHDLGPWGNAGSRDTLFDQYFPLTELQQRSNVLDSMGDATNAVHGFEAAGQQWIVLTLEWGPRDGTLDWADQMLRKYRDRRAILVTHAYTNDGDMRQDFRTFPEDKGNPHNYYTAQLSDGTNDGEEIWQKLVSYHPNVEFVLSGHVLGDGFGRLSSEHHNGHVVHQVLSNYQHYENDGNGYLRVMEFHPDGKTVQVTSYSPYLNRHYTDWENQFTLELTATKTAEQ